MQHQRAEGLLGDPPLRRGREPLAAGIALDDLDVDAQGGTVVDDRVLEPGIHPALGHRRVVRGDPVQQRDADGVVVHARGHHDHRDQQAQDVGSDAPLAAPALLARIQPRRLLRRVDRDVHGLGVHHDRRRVLAPPPALADLPAQQVMNHLVGTVVAPLAEVVVHRGVRREVVRQVAPLAAHPGLVQDRVDDLPHLVPALMAADRAVLSLPGRDDRPDQLPRLVRQITRIRLPLGHVSSTPQDRPTATHQTGQPATTTRRTPTKAPHRRRQRGSRRLLEAPPRRRA